MGSLYVFWKLIKPLAPYLVVLLVLAILAGVYLGQRAKIKGLEAGLYTAAVENQSLRKDIAAQDHLLERCSLQTELYKDKAERYRVRLHEALEQPPETVIRYRDRVRTVTETITAEECPDAIGEAVTVLKEALDESP